MKFFSLLFEGEVHPSDDKKILDSDSYLKLLEASEIVEKAQEGAERLEKEAKEKHLKESKKAKEQGFAQGLEKFNTAILKMEEELKSLRLSLLEHVLPIALKAAKRIVNKELEIFPETIVDIVIQTIRPISESRHVTIFVNKKDKEHLDHNKPKLKEALQQVESLLIQEKPDVNPGGCIIKTESGMIDATVEKQWKAFEIAFEKYKQTP